MQQRRNNQDQDGEQQNDDNDVVMQNLSTDQAVHNMDDFKVIFEQKTWSRSHQDELHHSCHGLGATATAVAITRETGDLRVRRCSV